MNRIILIGNGFDLAHGLKTSYADFINAFWMAKVRNLVTAGNLGVFNEDYDITILSSGKDKNGRPLIDSKCFTEARHQIKQLFLPSWEKNGFKISEFDTVLNKFGGEISYTNKFLETISKEMKEMKWVDIEEIYYKQILSLIKDTAVLNKEEVSPKIEKLNKDFERIKKALEKYLEWEMKRNPISEPDEYIKQNIYSIIEPEEVMSIGKDAIRTEKNLSRNQRDYVCCPANILSLNFNYTPTEKRYLNNGSISEVIHIHGELNNPDNPIIFGYGDELDDMYPAIEKTNENRFLENIKSINYFETDNYKILLRFVKSDLYQVCVFGHSCGISDRTLLNTLFEHKNCISIKVFYHQKEDGTDNYSEIVKNISRSFTDKAAMREKVVNKTYCKPLKGKSQQE